MSGNREIWIIWSYSYPLFSFDVYGPYTIDESGLWIYNSALFWTEKSLKIKLKESAFFAVNPKE